MVLYQLHLSSGCLNFFFLLLLSDAAFLFSMAVLCLKYTFFFYLCKSLWKIFSYLIVFQKYKKKMFEKRIIYSYIKHIPVGNHLSKTLHVWCWVVFSAPSNVMGWTRSGWIFFLVDFLYKFYRTYLNLFEEIR